MTFHVGQRVVCVNDRRVVLVKFAGWFSRWRPFVRLDHNLNRGDVYRVMRVLLIRTTDGGNIETIWVDKARYFENVDIGFPSFQFKPLIERKQQTDISTFTKLLTPNPQRRELVSSVNGEDINTL